MFIQYTQFSRSRFLYIVILYIFVKFGVVMKGFDTSTKRVVAVKRFKYLLYGQTSEDASTEAALIRKASNQYVIELIDMIEDGNGICLVFPLVESTLFDEIYNKKFDANRTKCVISMVLKAVDYIHSQKIIHRSPVIF